MIKWILSSYNFAFVLLHMQLVTLRCRNLGRGIYDFARMFKYEAPTFVAQVVFQAVHMARCARTLGQEQGEPWNTRQQRNVSVRWVRNEGSAQAE